MAELVTSFAANPAREGPQVITSWTFPSDFSSLVDEIKLVRKQGSFPESITDGKEVFSSTTFTETEFADLDVTRGVCFYYTMFSQRKSDALFVFDSTTQDEVMPYETGFFEDALFRKLPQLYRVQDALVGEQKILEESTVTTTEAGVRKGQKLNFKEDPTFPKGFLQRFLKNIALEFDKIKETADFFPTFIDVDETCASFLPRLAELVGITPNFDLPIPRQRDEIRRAVPSYKIKGTQSMLISLTSGILKVVPTVVLWRNNVLISNDLNSTSFSFEPEDVQKQFLEDDPNDYIADPDPLSYNLNRIALFFDVSGLEVSKNVINKLRRTLPDFIPARIELVFIFTSDDSEVYNASSTTESTADTITQGELYDAGNVTETTSDTILDQFLITNDPFRTTNSAFVTASAV